MAIKRTEELESLKLYGLSEVEPILGVTAQTMKRWIKEGKLNAVKVGGKWKVSEESIRAFVNRGK